MRLSAIPAIGHLGTVHTVTTRLAVEEDFDGSRGYGRLDYVVYCQGLAVLITEAKMTEMQNGITQNIVQLSTAAEVPNPTLLTLF